MTSPQRIQRKRTKGWRMPENTVYVGRPTFWGNPFVPELRDSQWWAKDENEVLYPLISNTKGAAVEKCVSLYLSELVQWSEKRMRLPELAGKDLMCWCTLDHPCHADVLLELANR